MIDQTLSQFKIAARLGVGGRGAVHRTALLLDGGGADYYMSAYGYPRRTTNLERLAAAGAVFDRAHSNSSWTRPSTPS